MAFPSPMPKLPPFVGKQQVAVTPSDTTVLNFAALYIGGTGDVTILPLDSSTPVTYHGYPGGAWLPCAGAKVMATGTAATNIVAVN